MGKQGRKNGTYKDGTAYSKGDKPKDDVHEVDMSRLTMKDCDDCREGSLTIEELMDKHDWTGGSVQKYWFPTPTKCRRCAEKAPYRVYTARDLAEEVMPHACVTREKVQQILAGVEMRSAQRNLDLMHKLGMQPDNIEMGRRMVRRVKEQYAHIKPAKRPPELIQRIRRELWAIDVDEACPSKARIVFQCADGDVSYSLTCMIMTSPRAPGAPPRPSEVVPWPPRADQVGAPATATERARVHVAAASTSAMAAMASMGIHIGAPLPAHTLPRRAPTVINDAPRVETNVDPYGVDAPCAEP